MQKVGNGPGALEVAHLLMIVFKEGGQKHFDLVVVATRGDVRVCSPGSRTATDDETRLKEAQI